MEIHLQRGTKLIERTKNNHLKQHHSPRFQEPTTIAPRNRCAIVLSKNGLVDYPKAYGSGRRREPPLQRDELLTAAVAAQMLGVSVTTLYDWLGQSNRGLLRIRNAPVSIDYLQGGPQGAGRIRIAATEVRRLIECMRVRPTAAPKRQLPTKSVAYPGIHVPLGKPT